MSAKFEKQNDNQELVIDNSDGKHPNRVLRIVKRSMPSANFLKYYFSVDWAGSYQADFSLSKDEMIELIRQLQSFL